MAFTAPEVDETGLPVDDAGADAGALEPGRKRDKLEKRPPDLVFSALVVLALVDWPSMGPAPVSGLGEADTVGRWVGGLGCLGG